MALNLSDLTGSSTSGDILAEVQTTADFLDSVPLLKNLADPSGATDAKQFTATKQPTALPLIDGEGYLYCPPVAGNYASTPDSSELDITGDITLECDFIVPEFPTDAYLVSKYNTATDNRSYRLLITTTGSIRFTISATGTYSSAYNKTQDFNSVLNAKTKATVKVSWRQSDGRTQFFIKESDGSFSQVGSDQFITAPSIYNSNQEIEIGTEDSGVFVASSSLGVFGARIYASVDGTDKRLDVDFTSPRIPHGATEFECETGQVVTVNTSGNNPAKVIKKPVLRFDGADDALRGIFANNIDGGYMFAAFSVLGDGGSNANGRIFGVNASGFGDSSSSGFIYSLQYSGTNDLGYYNEGWSNLNADMFDDANGDILHEVKAIAGSQFSKVNNAGIETTSLSLTSVSAEEFNISSTHLGGSNTAIDLEYLALFPASLTDAQADQIRNFINNRNKVFYRWDTDGYYFFDGAATDDGQVFSGSGSWNGRIVGSDNGDSDFYISQNTLDDRPTTDGYKITFADNTDHFDIPSTSQAGWQIVGTSLGTFAYKVNDNAVTELNLLGNKGATRRYGDLYGIILLPESATNRDIEEARKLLIDRGASDGLTVTYLSGFWQDRADIVLMKPVDMTNVDNISYSWRHTDIESFDGFDFPDATNAAHAFLGTPITSFSSKMPLAENVRYAWFQCSSLKSFSTQLPEATRVDLAWYANTSLSSFTTTDIKNCSNFSEAWRNCSSLQSFPEGALLGTEASNVVFNNAWRKSGLTSFSTPLPTATSLTASWRDCYSLANFDISELPLVTDLRQAFLNCDLSTFSTELPKSEAFQYCWNGCSSLTDFSADVFANWNPSSISNVVFNLTWTGCTSLTAQSVENILTSIAASGTWATTNGASDGTALTNATIDIDYDVTTGSLTAATLTAIETLNGRGWSVNINNEIIVPNILQLQPAAAYSLRSFDADADPTVVNVRRSSDGSLSDFTASQVSDGTLTSWVNTDVDLVTPTLNNGGFEDGLTGWSSGSVTVDTNEFYAGTQSAKMTIVGGGGGYFGKSILQSGLSYRVGFWAKISDTSKQIRVEFGSSGNAELISFSSTDWEYKEVTKTANGGSLSFVRQTTSGDYSVNFDNVTVTQLTADGYVTTWYDQSGNSVYNLTQSTASAQPKLVDNGVLVTEGGEAALDFDGSDDELVLNTAISATTDPRTYLAVFTTNDDNGLIVGGNNPSFYDTYGNALYIRNSEIKGKALNNSNGVLLESGITPNATYLATLRLLDTDSSIYVNGTEEATNSNNLYWHSYNTQIGGGQYVNDNMDGTIQEIVIFDTDQSANRAAIEKNINDHFNIY